MLKQAVIAGGGIGGLAAALSASRAGWDVRLLERAAAFSEVGAGVQLGPNVVRILHAWGLEDALAAVAAFPDRLQVRSARGGDTLAQLPLGQAMVRRYGSPYVTVHRADLQTVLLQAVQQHTDTKLHLERAFNVFSETSQGVMVQSAGCPGIEGDVLVGADGVWSKVRQQLLNDGPPRRTGHLAYRALIRQASLPPTLRCAHVMVWLAPGMHVVQYPVRGGEWLNVVILMQGEGDDAPEAWDHTLDEADLRRLAAVRTASCATLHDLLHSVGEGPGWRRWALHDRPPMQGPHQHAAGHVALLGDAAHPMRPYLAQGAGMAIEDAAELGHALAQALDPAFDVPTLLQRYALNRWQRNARVQTRALANGEIFHLDGVMRVARDLSMRLLGAKVLDMGWLYGGGTKRS